jgi:formate hydrogenlyase subunit 6/NADH:ubiquinone oxidoreductase subunit I
MSKEEYEGIPRNKISWDPKIDYDKCTTCGKCVDFCHMKAFKIEEKDDTKKTVVTPVLFSAEVAKTFVLLVL